MKLQLDLFSTNFDKWSPIKLFLYKERLLFHNKERVISQASVSMFVRPSLEHSPPEDYQNTLELSLEGAGQIIVDKVNIHTFNIETFILFVQGRRVYYATLCSIIP